MDPCLECDASGKQNDGGPCPVCDGTGVDFVRITSGNPDLDRRAIDQLRKLLEEQPK